MEQAALPSAAFFIAAENGCRLDLGLLGGGFSVEGGDTVANLIGGIVDASHRAACSTVCGKGSAKPNGRWKQITVSERRFLKPLV